MALRRAGEWIQVHSPARCCSATVAGWGRLRSGRLLAQNPVLRDLVPRDWVYAGQAPAVPVPETLARPLLSRKTGQRNDAVIGPWRASPNW